MKKYTSEESIQFLKEQGIEMSSHSLVYYSQEGQATIVEHLLNSGLNPNSWTTSANVLMQTTESYNALIQATRKNHFEVVKVLINHGADTNVYSSQKGVLYWSILNENKTLVEYFLSIGISVDENLENLPPILAAITKKNKEIIKILIEKGAKLDCQFRFSNTQITHDLIYYTYHEVDKELYNYLVELGANRLSEEQKRKKTWWHNYIEELKVSYSKKSPVFLGLNILFFLIVLFTHNNIFSGIVLLTIFGIIGGLIGRNSDNAIKGLKTGTIVMLSIAFIFAWSADEYDSNPQKYSSPSSSSIHTCGYCNASFSGNGWSTVGGEQFQKSSWSGYGYCSKKCAWESQPNKWKYAK